MKPIMTTEALAEHALKFWADELLDFCLARAEGEAERIALLAEDLREDPSTQEVLGDFDLSQVDYHAVATSIVRGLPAVIDMGGSERPYDNKFLA